MDQVALLYYASICAILGFFAPSIGRWPMRLFVGALVGIAGSAMLPIVRGLL